MSRPGPNFTSLRAHAKNLVKRVDELAVEPLRNIWFTAFLSIGLLLLLVFPNLGSEQAREAMLNYAPNPNAPWPHFAWHTALATMGVVAILSAALRFWTLKLFGIDPRKHVRGTLPPIHSALVLLIWFGPWLGLAATYFFVNGQLPAQERLWTPYTLLAIISIVVPLVSTAFFLSGAVAPAREAFRSNVAIQRVLQSALPLSLLAAILIFGSAGRSSVFGLPLDAVGLAQSIGPLALLTFALAVTTALGSWFIVFGRSVRLPIFWLVAIVPTAWGLFNNNDNHPVRELAPRSSTTVSLEQGLISWDRLHSDPAIQHKPILIVSTEGGGIRAAYFTAITLARIADDCPAAANRMFAISSVSGGSLGAAVYASALNVKPLNPSDTRCAFPRNPSPGWYEQRIDQVFRRDHLSPLLSRMLFPDTAQRFLPFPIDGYDRQLGLEYSLEDAFRDVFGQNSLETSIYDVGPSTNTPSTPFLFLNTTSVERGDRVIGTPIEMVEPDFVKPRSFYDLSPSTNFPLISIAATSARFPYITPAGYVRHDNSKERFVDGGYFDNSGAVTVLEIYQALTELRSRHNPIAAIKDHSVLVLHIGNQQECDPGAASAATAKACHDAPSESFEETLSPLRAVLTTRSSRVDYTLGALDRTLARSEEGGQPDELFRIQMIDDNVPVPLGWFLSSRAANEMRRQLYPTDNTDCGTRTRVENACVFGDLARSFGTQ